MSKVLIVASVASMIDQFNRSNIKLLKELGFDVHVACNFIEGNTCSSEKIQQLKTDLQSEEVTFSQVDFARNITRFSQNFRAFRQMRQLLKQEKYDLIHCHSPIGGLLTRIAANKYRKKGTTVIYTAHGFHFYKGAPLKNWLIFYPVEWICSYWTDILITINREDYARAQKHMHAKRVEYIPGVGIDTKLFSLNSVEKEKRKEFRLSIGVGEEDTLLLSVGELNENKNHSAVIRALAQLKNPHIHYAIAGVGDLQDSLINLSKELKLDSRIHLLGFRTDMPDLYKAADVYIHPSFREGLPVSLMEAMASGLPCIASNIRGNRDLLEDKRLVEPSDISGFAKKIEEFTDRDFCRTVGIENKSRINKLDHLEINRQISALYNEKRHAV